MSRPRDSQLSKVYRAEAELIRQLRDIFPDDMHRLDDELSMVLWDYERSRWMRHRCPDIRYQPFHLVENCHSQLVCWSRDVLSYSDRRPFSGQWKLGLSASSTRVHVIHAVLHYVVPDDVQLHGPEFARLYIQALRHYIGPEAGTAAVELFKAHRIKARVVSQAAKDAARRRAIGKEIARKARDEPSPLIPNTNKDAAKVAALRDTLHTEPNGASS